MFSAKEAATIGGILANRRKIGAKLGSNNRQHFGKKRHENRRHSSQNI